MGLGATIAEALGLRAPANLALGNVFQAPSDSLAQIVISDLDMANTVTVDRAMALSIAPFAKGLDLVCSVVAGFPLKAVRGDTVLDQGDQPTWMYADDDPVSAYLRMRYTVADLIFDDISVWRLTRGVKPEGARYAPILRAQRVPPSRWSWDDYQGATRLHIDGQPMGDDDVIVFDGIHDGIGALRRGRDDLLQAKRLARGRASKAITSSAAWIINPTEDIQFSTEANPSDEDELAARQQFVDDISNRRQSPTGAVIFGDPRFTIQEIGVGADAAVAMTEAMNGVRLDMANLLGIPAMLLDGSTATASLTYQTESGVRSQLTDLSSIADWTQVIEGRLSQADVLPLGQRAVLDRSDFYAALPSPVGADTENQSTDPAPQKAPVTPIRQGATA